MEKELLKEKELSSHLILVNYFMIIASIVLAFGFIYLILAFSFWFEFLHEDTIFDLFKHILIGAFITAL